MGKIKEHHKMMMTLQKEFGNVYFDLFGNCLLSGMNIETAIYYCWNKLKTKNNG